MNSIKNDIIRALTGLGYSEGTISEDLKDIFILCIILFLVAKPTLIKEEKLYYERLHNPKYEKVTEEDYQIEKENPYDKARKEYKEKERYERKQKENRDKEAKIPKPVIFIAIIILFFKLKNKDKRGRRRRRISNNGTPFN